MTMPHSGDNLSEVLVDLKIVVIPTQTWSGHKIESFLPEPSCAEQAGVAFCVWLYEGLEAKCGTLSFCCYIAGAIIWLKTFYALR